MEKVLKLYKYIDGSNDTPFPNVEYQAVVSDFRYDVKRMGGAPIITCTLMHTLCLDKLWSENVYAYFNGERFFIKQIPTSSYNNTDSRYKHELELVSERFVLDNVYFYDVVDSSENNDKPVSNSSKFSFFGDINEFASRLNQSLQYSNVDYSVVVDDGISSEAKMVSFQDQFFSGAIQEGYNTYNVPFYFEGKVIHFGYTNNAITHTFKYGQDESILSIQKQNANYKVVNRVTGVGSADNIPYYYPNDSEKGESKALYNGSSDNVQIVDTNKYDKLYLSDTFKYEYISPVTSVPFGKHDYRSIDYKKLNFNQKQIVLTYFITIYEDQVLKFFQKLNGVNSKSDAHIYGVDNEFEDYILGSYEKTLKTGQYKIVIEDVATIYLDDSMGDEWVTYVLDNYFELEVSLTTLGYNGWSLNGKPVYLKDYGLSALVSPQVGDVITFEQTSYIAPQKHLMPPIYRESLGKERFYNALNNEYQDGNGGYYEFDNPYVDGKPKEQIVSFEHIKPSIVGATNANGQRIDMFIDFAYDENDNDETKIVDGEEVYAHPYFFAKLRKFDGQFGFNLFDHAIDEGEMTISMTSGSCGACNFIVRVNEENKNIVQVDSNGNLKRGDNGDVLFGEPQDRQNDTIHNEVWVALKKDTDTFGVIMPNASNKYKPSTNDTFVILHIDLPYAYIEQAENKLKDEIIKYMSLNNSEKFTFSITFSRIFFAENPSILAQLNENARIQIEYDGNTYELYISSYSYVVDSNSPLPEIKVELSDTLTIAQNALQNAISEVKNDILSNIGNSQDFLKQGLRYFLRKDTNDRSKGVIASDKGFEAGRFVRGFLGGTGAWIGADGYGEMSGLTLREFLEVPELRFNRIDVVSGELWNAIAFGMVEEVDTEKRICKIKLEENERCGLHVGDFCRGIFADFEDGIKSEGIDKNNFIQLYGFKTSYFKPIEILENKEGVFVFKYDICPGTDVHPCASMKFAVYGNEIDPSRRASAYSTRTYKRYLNNVNTWKIDPDKHIYAQYGDLTGLTIGGVEMKGYGSFQSNAYFRGVQIQLPPEQLEELRGESAYSVMLSSSNDVVTVDADGNMGNVYEKLNVVTNGENVVTNGKNVVTSVFKLKTDVQVRKGSKVLYYSTFDAVDSYTLSIEPVGCEAVVMNGIIIISNVLDQNNCYVNINVTCEGKATFRLIYRVTFVKDGKVGKDSLSYRITPNIATLGKTMTGSIDPESITFKLYKNQGEQSTLFPGLWVLQGRNSSDEDWEFVRSSNFQTETWTCLFSGGWKYYRVQATGSGNSLYDEKEITVVADGKSGSMARYRGEFEFYNDSEPYVYNGEYRDVVLYEGNVYQVYAYGSSVTDAPSVSANSDNDGKWQRANQFRFVAMDTALIDNANIAGFTFRRKKYINNSPVGVMRSQYGPICISSVSQDFVSGNEIGITINGAYTKYIKIRKFNQTAYELVPSIEAIVRRKNSSGEWVYDVSSISCSIKKITEGGSTIVSSVSGYTLKYAKDSGIETSGSSVSTSGATSSITFILYDSKNVEVERQSIPVLSEGDTSVKAVVDNDTVILLVNDNNEVIYGMPHRFKATLWKGINEISITNISFSNTSNVEISNEYIEIDTESGAFKCTNAYITGEVNANEGTFRNVEIKNANMKNGLLEAELSSNAVDGYPGISWMYDKTEYARLGMWVVNGQVSGVLKMSNNSAWKESSILHPGMLVLAGKKSRFTSNFETLLSYDGVIFRTENSSYSSGMLVDYAGCLVINSDYWPAESYVADGAVYVDKSGYLKVKNPNRIEI